MKTPRQLVRCCGRRRCVLPMALALAVFYLVMEKPAYEQQAEAWARKEVETGAEGFSTVSHLHPGHGLPAPRNPQESLQVAEHLARMAAEPADKPVDGHPMQGEDPTHGLTRSPPQAPPKHIMPLLPPEPAHLTPSQERSAARGHKAVHHAATEADAHMEALDSPKQAAAAQTAAAAAAATATSAVNTGPKASGKVATFYYPWYGAPEVDGKWAHWDHPQIEFWNTQQRDKYPHGESTRRHPPGSVGSNFYPAAGPYSSRDPAVVATHMKQMRDAGIGVVVVSWYPPGTQDAVQGGKEIMVEDGVLMPLLLKCAAAEGLKLALHVEPYDGRNAATLRRDLEYASKSYGDHPAMQKEKGRIVYYLYDSYREPASEWAKIFAPSGAQSVRGTGDFSGFSLFSRCVSH